MKPTNLTFILISSLGLATACAGSDADSIQVRAAALTEDGDTGPALEANVDWDGWMVYGAFRQIDGANRYHHVEIIDYRGGDGPTLEVGRTYVDGPTVAGRGTVDDWLGPDGILVGDFPIPWIDALVCDGSSYASMSNCAMAERTEVTLTDAGAGAVRFDYRLFMRGDTTTPSVSGTFTAEHGKIGAIPGA